MTFARVNADLRVADVISNRFFVLRPNITTRAIVATICPNLLVWRAREAIRELSCLLLVVTIIAGGLGSGVGELVEVGRLGKINCTMDGRADEELFYGDDLIQVSLNHLIQVSERYDVARAQYRHLDAVGSSLRNQCLFPAQTFTMAFSN
jgi:hypothetical protein